jgi:translation initiation factor 1
MNPRSENPTVYSTESGRICPTCGRPEAQCICKKKSAAPLGDGVVRVQIESKGRGGKTVSRVTGLALNEEGLKKLAGELKRVCGSGGTVKDGVIEIQGDHRDTLVDALKKQGIKAKRV